MSETENPGGELPGEAVVELLGVARLLARRETVSLALEGPVSLPAFLYRLSGEVPGLVGTVLDEQGGLLGGHVLSRGGVDLLRDADQLVHPGDRLLLLSLSAGG